MGLDVTHGCWRGPYSAFGRWRANVAAAAGYTMKKNDRGYYQAELDWDSFDPRCYVGFWQDSRWESEPLLILLVHSDCEGIISGYQAGLLADALEKLLPAIHAGKGREQLGNWAEDAGPDTETFIAGLRAAAEAGEMARFH